MAKEINKQYPNSAERRAFMSLQICPGSVGGEGRCFLNNMNAFSSFAYVLTLFP